MKNLRIKKWVRTYASTVLTHFFSDLIFQNSILWQAFSYKTFSTEVCGCANGAFAGPVSGPVPDVYRRKLLELRRRCTNHRRRLLYQRRRHTGKAGLAGRRPVSEQHQRRMWDAPSFTDIRRVVATSVCWQKIHGETSFRQDCVSPWVLYFVLWWSGYQTPDSRVACGDIG